MKTPRNPAPGTARKERANGDVPKIPLRDLSRSLPMALMRAREAVMQYFRPHHRLHGITEQQWRVLRVLYKSGDLEIAELARQTVLMPPSLSRILRDLEAAKMVSRRVVRTDLRRSVISIAPAGLEMLTKIAPLSEASFAEIQQLFGEQRLDQLFDLLYELERKLKKPAVQAASPDGTEEAEDAGEPRTRRKRSVHRPVSRP
ncbi:MAG TPA: homoprotocatechuate degradation operon regulator HpaR [Steroidobacteraceae bacterium]|nr:homoprotocatechuate degradation operon regulator HpaR [Steroidobacteraceae bacterium]